MSATAETTQGTVFSDANWNGKVYSSGWRATERTIDVIEPATALPLTRTGVATAADIGSAAVAAAQAQTDWAATAYRERGALFLRAAEWLAAHGAEFTPWIMRETGAIRAKAEFELGEASILLREAASMCSQPQGEVLPSTPGRMSLARRIPMGVVGVISPFNFPLILSLRAIAPALAAGNGVVHKPDPRTPVTGGFLIAEMFDAVGLPEGLLHIVPGEIEAGEALCSDPNIAMIAFTGSTAAGRKVGELCGRHLKKVSLELGGKNSLIILDDADLDLAASNAAFGAWFHQGQICMTSGRILAHESIVDALTERLAEKARHLPVGDPMSETVALGPIINQRQLEHVDGIVKDTVTAGARLVAGGSHEQLFYSPTVISGVKPGMRAFDEEMFGPVASITTFSSDEEAIELANGTEYGLSAAIISKSVGRAMALGERLHTGLLHINDQTVADEMVNPFGGRGASGNGTSIGGPSNWEEFTQWQWVTIKDTPPSYPF